MSATRRGILSGLALSPLLAAFGASAAAQEFNRRPQDRNAALPKFGPAKPFSFDDLRAMASGLAARPYVARAERGSAILDKIGYDQHHKIAMQRDYELRAPGSPVSFDLFHLANLFRVPVKIHVVAGGVAREVVYSHRLFTYRDEAEIGRALPPDAGFAGFRARNAKTRSESVAFLGASYFRSPGALGEFGISARGIAVDPGLDEPEEFPGFTALWLEHKPGPRENFVLYALLDGPSLTGAYKFDTVRARGVTMDVEASLFLRNDVTRLGLAPLTSMFWYGKHNRHQAIDWRPQVHDSDGLKIWTGGGEHVWRPLINPPAREISSFVDNGIKGFGLLQRDRDFANYEDPNVHYEKRPSLWVEPRGNWGEGAVQLLELPTAGEFNDNIVAYWLSAEPAKAGAARSLAYRLHWVSDEPYPSGRAAVVATRIGSFGVQDPRSRKFAVDFAGGPLAALRDPADAAGGVEFVATAPRGKFDRIHTMRVEGTPRWRAIFEYAAEGNEPVDLRGFLRRNGEALSETWLFKLIPSDR